MLWIENFGVTALLALVDLVIGLVTRNKKRPPERQQAHAAAPPSPNLDLDEPEPQKGLQGLTQYLVDRRKDAETEKGEDRDRRAHLMANWDLISHETTRAIELVNAALAAQDDLRLIPRTPAFVGPDNDPVGYGIEIEIEGGCELGRPIADHIYVVAYEKHASVDDPFGDGEELPLRGLAAEKIADEMAERVRGLLEG